MQFIAVIFFSSKTEFLVEPSFPNIQCMMSFLSHPKIDRIFQFLEFLLLLFCKTV